MKAVIRLIKPYLFFIFLVIVSFYSQSIIAQTSFLDNLSGETNGNFPSKWKLIRGSAEIASFNGESIIYFSNKAIITPSLNSNNYLSNNFTLEFDAYYDDVRRNPVDQYYNIRFWDGEGSSEVGKSYFMALTAYLHGSRITGYINGKHTKYEGYNEAKREKQGLWRKITVNYNNGALKVFIDGFLAVNIPYIEFNPSMISIEAYANAYTDFIRGIKNIRITGIQINANNNEDNNNPIDNGNSGTDTTNTTTQNNYNYTLPTEDGTSSQILQTDGNGTVSWVDNNTVIDSTNTNSTGLEAINESNGIGWRLIGRDPNNYGNIGRGAVDLSTSLISSDSNGATGKYSIAMGMSTRASGSFSRTMGSGTKASGTASTAMGYGTIASGYSSTAMGESTEASGYYSIAIGFRAIASGESSTAMGYRTNANAFASVAIGKDNVGGGNPTTWIKTDKLFEVGNGFASSPRNAFTILKNGKVGIGTSEPNVKLQITGGSDASYSNGTGYIVLGRESSSNIVIDANEIMARKNGVSSPLYIQNSGGELYVGGAIVHSSDARLKQDIENLNYGLKEILELRPVSYYWKSKKTPQKSLGLIAQEVQPYLKELVTINTKRDNTLGINYTELIPILIKAIQEQQELINSLQTTVNKQQSTIQKQDSKINNLNTEMAQIQSLEQRINNMEQILKSTQQ